ncbi:MAG TPA: hypothetical protein VIP51_13635 [Eoetvoesiella sp.]
MIFTKFLSIATWLRTKIAQKKSQKNYPQRNKGGMGLVFFGSKMG